jgi:single-strand DNA-binding protein
MNIVVLRGVLSSTPVIRELSSGSIVHTLEVTTRDEHGRSASVPVAWFDPPAASTLDTGVEVVVTGSVRRRFFRAGGATQSRTEVVATAVVPASRRRQVERAVSRAVGSASDMTTT